MDIVYYNGCIHTLDNQNNVTQAVGLEGGNIAFVGTNQEALALDCPKKIDLGGKLMLPGFVDSHLHFLNHAFVTQSLKLFDCTSVESLLEGVTQRYQKELTSGGHWVYGRGWNEGNFDRPDYPTLAQLDAIGTDLPILVVRVCGHVAVTNSAGLAKLTALPGFDKVAAQVDAQAGLLKEDAVRLFYSLLETPPKEAIAQFVTAGLADVNRAGITSVHSDDFNGLPGKNWKSILDVMTDLSQQGKLTARIYEQCRFDRKEDVAAFLDLGYRTGDGNDFFTIGPIKLLQDGSLGARTAALEAPYADQADNQGILVFEPEELAEIVALCDKNQMQLAIHCIGDRAVRTTLDAIEASPYRASNPKNRHGIVHAQITNPDHLHRMAQGEILAYIQPVFVDLDMDVVESRVGAGRMATSYAWKSMLDLGIPTLGGSDAPVVPFDVLENIYFAVTRENQKGNPPGGWLPQEKLTVDEAVRLFCQAPHYGSYTQDIGGSIQVGKQADLVVLEEDIYTIAPSRIKDVPVYLTIVNGQIVYQAS